MEYDLEFLGVSKQFGDFTAVDNVSFDIPSGSFFSILGPSGCGKTTIMRMIAGFESLTSGDIKIKGNSVVHVPPNKRNVKMVFQHLALFPMMNVRENIEYGLHCKGIKEKSEINKRVNDVLERISLPNVGEKEIHQLSGGQKQRIAIARCLVLEPDVLLLDEPLGALDLKLRESMKIELKLLQHQFGTTFIYITHDQSEALVMSDHVAVMKDGRFEQIGTPKDLYRRPETAFVAGFVGDANRWQGQVIESDEKQITVKTDSGFILSTETADVNAKAVGKQVEIFVRPEFLSIEKSPSNISQTDKNSLPGVVDSLLFNGANSRVLVRTDNDQLIEADFQFDSDDTDLKQGESVNLTWPAQQSVCFAIG